MIVRMTVAEEHSETLGFPISFEDIILLAGASQREGMFLKGSERKELAFSSVVMRYL